MEKYELVTDIKVSVPSRGIQVYIVDFDIHSEKEAMFPSPPEVYRLISNTWLNSTKHNLTVSVPSRGRQVYILQMVFLKMHGVECFRPLSSEQVYKAPLPEADEPQPLSFRPLSRYIGLYLDSWAEQGVSVFQFPSPLEVDRFISNQLPFSIRHTNGYRPLSRQIGLYRTLMLQARSFIRCFRPLSRYIGLYLIKKYIYENIANTVSVPSRGIQVYIWKREGITE